MKYFVIANFDNTSFIGIDKNSGGYLYETSYLFKALIDKLYNNLCYCIKNDLRYLEGIMAKKPVMLMILDGFGIAPKGDGNAVEAAISC